MEILSAEWVVPVTTPVISDGSIVIENGRIIEIGKRPDILLKFHGTEESKYNSVLMPGLVNGHMHLELSHICDIAPMSPESTFTDWISELLTRRQNETPDRSHVIDAFSAALRDQFVSGVALVADIGNTVFPELYEQKGEGWPEVIRMVECLAPNRQALQVAKKNIAGMPDRYPVCVHAAYSTSPDLFVSAKQRCRQLDHIFSVHTAESAAELEFLRFGTGCFRDFLESRKSWDGTFAFAEQGYVGTIFYFDHLGILDKNTLLVHAVHVSERELALVAERGAYICLCPGSNRFLHVGRAPVEQMLAAGILPSLGTDSLASNESINLWREMQLLAEDHPQVTYELILAMATLGGAQALHRDEDFGSLVPGKRSQILHVSSPALSCCRDKSRVIQELVTGGQPSEIAWASTH
ncbi:MAG: amidohydrolase family protein [Pseudomonadota bacterium]